MGIITNVEALVKRVRTEISTQAKADIIEMVTALKNKFDEIGDTVKDWSGEELSHIKDLVEAIEHSIVKLEPTLPTTVQPQIEVTNVPSGS